MIGLPLLRERGKLARFGDSDRRGGFLAVCAHLLLLGLEACQAPENR